MKIFSPILKGTTTVAQGTTNLSGSFTGSLLGTAATASYADNFTVGGTLTAQTINVQIITSSIEFVTGSTRNGSLAANTHEFTGSVLMTGSLIVTRGTFNPSLVAIGSSAGNGQIQISNSSNYVIGAGTDYGGMSFTVGGSERFNILNNGNVGIGTTSPLYRIHIAATGSNVFLGISNQGAANGDRQLRMGFGGNGLNTFAEFQGTRANVADDVNIVMQAGGGSVSIGTTVSKATLQVSSILTGVPSIPSLGSTNGYVTTYFTNPNSLYGLLGGSLNDGSYWMQVQRTDGTAEAYNLNLQPNGGNVNFGPSSLVWGFENQGIKLSKSGVGPKISLWAVNQYLYLGYAESGGWERVYAQATSGGVYLTNGATSWTSNSDERLKNITGTIENATGKLSTLRTVKYNWKEDTLNREYLGLIAQDVQQVLPEIIDVDTNDEVGTLGVRYTELIPVLVKAIQELKSENDTLKEILQRNNIQ
jgi:hypothetical protein